MRKRFRAYARDPWKQQIQLLCCKFESGQTSIGDWITLSPEMRDDLIAAMSDTDKFRLRCFDLTWNRRLYVNPATFELLVVTWYDNIPGSIYHYLFEGRLMLADNGNRVEQVSDTWNELLAWLKEPYDEATYQAETE